MDKIIKLFLENPEKEFHIREIAKLTNISPTTVSKYANILMKKKLVVSRRLSNHLLVRANSDNAHFKRVKSNTNIESIYDSRLLDYLEKELNNPEAAILFGSFLRGEDISGSDIDLFIITPLKKELNLEKYEKKLRHRLQIFMHSRKEVESMKLNNKELLNNLVNGKVIYGYWEVF